MERPSRIFEIPARDSAEAWFAYLLKLRVLLHDVSQEASYFEILGSAYVDRKSVL